MPPSSIGKKTYELHWTDPKISPCIVAHARFVLDTPGASSLRCTTVQCKWGTGRSLNDERKPGAFAHLREHEGQLSNSITRDKALLDDCLALPSLNATVMLEDFPGFRTLLALVMILYREGFGNLARVTVPHGKTLTSKRRKTLQQTTHLEHRWHTGPSRTHFIFLRWHSTHTFHARCGLFTPFVFSVRFAAAVTEFLSLPVLMSLELTHLAFVVVEHPALIVLLFSLFESYIGEGWSFFGNEW